MSTITKTEPQARMGSRANIRLLGLAALIGGLLWWLLNISEPLDIPLGPPVAQGLIGVVLLVGLMGGPLGLLALRATDNRRMGRAGVVIALLGLLSYLTGQSLQTVLGLATSQIGVFYAAGALLVGLGMLPLGLAATLARRLSGWRQFAPLLVGMYYALTIPLQIVFFIGPNGIPSNTLLAFWGLTCALLGYAIFSTLEPPHAGRR
jgi:hypothetical protein